MHGPPCSECAGIRTTHSFERTLRAPCRLTPTALEQGLQTHEGNHAMGLFDFLTSNQTNTSADEAKALVKQGALLLDVRTPAEFSGGHISGAKNIPVQELPNRMSELPPTSRQIVVYCRSGGRSASASSLLRQAGYTVHDLGAMHNWQ